MKQIYYDIIGESYWSDKHNQKSKHPQERLKELGIELIIGIPESIADCWNALVEDFDCELPSYIEARKNISWDYFYKYNPNKCKDAMIRCGVDYKSVIDQVEREDERYERIKRENKERFDNLYLATVKSVSAYDMDGNLIFTLDDIK